MRTRTRPILTIAAAFLIALSVAAPTWAQFNDPASRFKRATFANLATPNDGDVRYCTDCTAGSPCTGSGSGAVASRVAGAWNCSSGSGVVYPLLAPDGTVGAPSYSFASDPDTGFYSTSSGVIGYSANGTNSISFGASSLSVSGGTVVIGASAIQGTLKLFDGAGASKGLLIRNSAGTGPAPVRSLIINSASFTGDITWTLANASGAPVLDSATQTLTGKTIATTGNTISGTVAADDAVAGTIGEVLSGTIATGSSVSLTTNTAATVTSVSLTAGDWDCTGVVDYTPGATTSITMLQQGISTTDATIGAQDTFTLWATAANVPTAANDPAWATPVVRVNVGGTTTTYLVAKATFTVSTLKAYGSIRCRRVR